MTLYYINDVELWCVNLEWTNNNNPQICGIVITDYSAYKLLQCGAELIIVNN